MFSLLIYIVTYCFPFLLLKLNPLKVALTNLSQLSRLSPKWAVCLQDGRWSSDIAVLLSFAIIFAILDRTWVWECPPPPVQLPPNCESFATKANVKLGMFWIQ